MDTDEASVTEVHYCANCGHKITLKGEVNTSQYWQCQYNCRCLMRGCVPQSAKYGTEAS